MFNNYYIEVVNKVMKRQIADYLNKKETKVLIQAHISQDLADAIKVIMDKQGLSWSKLITACLKCYLDEENEK